MFFVIPIPRFSSGSRGSETCVKLVVMAVFLFIVIGIILGIRSPSANNSYSTYGGASSYSKSYGVDTIFEAPKGVAVILLSSFESSSRIGSVLDWIYISWRAHGKTLSNGDYNFDPVLTDSDTSNKRYKVFTKRGEISWEWDRKVRRTNTYLFIEFGSTLADSGFYEATASTSLYGGRTLTSKHLAIFKDKGPTKFIGVNGESASLPCFILADNPVIFNWKKGDGTPLTSNSDRIKIFASFDSFAPNVTLFKDLYPITRISRSSILHFTDTKMEDAGIYTCRDTSSDNFKMEQEFQLAIQEKKDPLNSPFGGMSPCSCQMSLDFVPTITWRRNGQLFLVSNFSSEVNQTELTSSTFTSNFTIGRFDDRFIDDWRNVTCSANNTNLSLTMEVKTLNGETFVFCSFTGTNESNIRLNWTKEDGKLPFMSEIASNNRSGSYDTVLFIPKASKRDSGNYSCAMSSQSGQIMTGTVLLNFTDSQMEPVKVMVNKTAVLDCNAGTKGIKIDWTKNGTTLNSTDTRYERYSGKLNLKDYKKFEIFSPKLMNIAYKLKNKSFVKKYYLIIRNVKLDDAGIYKCSKMSNQSYNMTVHF